LCELPGFSIDEILASKRFKDNAVNFAFNALQELKLIEPNIEFQGKTRFIIPDKKLHRLLVNMWVIHDAEFSCLIEKWEFFDKPTVKEENRMERLLGKQEAHRLFRKLHSARSQHNLELRKFATSEEYHQHIKKRCSSYLEELAWDATLEEFKFKIRGDRRIVTKKEKRGDILMYVNFMKAKLYDSLERLPVDHVDDNMEDFRMEYRETLRKYSFFRPVLKEICPKAFEADHDSESTLGEQNESLIKKRQSGIVIHIKGIRGKENKRSSSRGKKIVKIPYEWMKMHDHENNIDKEYPVFDLTNI
jgi:hypothetical protein